MSIKKLQGYIGKSTNQHLLCAIETCLDYAAFNSIFCHHHDAQADKAWQSLDADYSESATGDDSDVVVLTVQGYTTAKASQHRSRTSISKQLAPTTYRTWTSSDGGDAA
jgi:hypothetical protein